MNRLKIWKNWDADIRYPYLFLLILTGLVLLVSAYYYFSGVNAAYTWDKLSELQVVPVPVHEFTSMLMPFTLSADGYLLLEQYDVGLPDISTGPAIFFLAIIVICIAFYTAAASTMKQVPYIGAILLLMLFLASFNLDSLGIYSSSGSGQTLLLVSIALLASVSYLFHSFLQKTPFTWRLISILAVVLIFGSLIFTEAKLPAQITALHLVSYSSIGTLVATLLFFIWVSYENINALLWINTQAKTPERRFSLGQFLLISLLYLVNLLLLYLRHVGYVDMDLFYVNGYAILLLSVIAGFWGMRQREAYYGRFFPFKPTGAILYLVFATLTFFSIGYAYITANDTLTVLFHDLIVYTHLAYGFMFFVYVMMNFAALIRQRLPVYKVVYQPQRLPLYTLYTMGTIILVIMVMRTQYRTYFYAYAGYYNYLGDLYMASDNNILAERFYQESDVYDNNNVKANYSLASIYRVKQQRNNEVVRLKQALEKRPNPKMFVRLANMYNEREFFFEKLFVLRQGIATFPENGELYNNMALHYMQTSVLDSVDYYFDLAQQHSTEKDFVRSNRLAFYTRQAMLDEADDLLDESHGSKYKPLRTNMTTLRQLLGRQPDEKNNYIPDSLTSVEDFTLFYNSSIRRLGNGDTACVKPIDTFLRNSGNQLFAEDLLFLKGLVHHYDGRPKEARSVVENLALLAGNKSGYYYHVLGLWMMEEQNYDAAASYFERAKEGGNPESYLPHGFALAQAHRAREAEQALREVGETGIESAIEVAQSLLAVLEQDVQTIITDAPDTDKVQYLLTYLPNLGLQDLDAIVNSVKEKELRRYALMARVDYLIEQNRWKLANDAIKEASPVLQPEGELRSALNLQQMRVWLNTNNHNVLLGRMDNLFLTQRDKRYKLYFRARISEAKDRTREAAEQYEQALRMLLYDEEVVAAAAAFYAKSQPEAMRAYDTLLDGITYNPYSAKLHQAYALESIRKGLESYAQQSVSRLRDLLPPSEYSTFIQKYEKQRRDQEAAAQNWQL